MADETRPPIPASLAHRPVRDGIAQAWVNAELADGGTDFRSPHTAKYEQAWRECLCQSCGNPTGPRAVLVCGPRQVPARPAKTARPAKAKPLDVGAEIDRAQSRAVQQTRRANQRMRTVTR